MRGRVPAGSGLLIVPAAAMVVHQLRFTLAYGARANAELAAQGHSYVSSLVPWTIFALGVGFTMFLRRLARTLGGREQVRPARRHAVVVWLGAWLGLFAIYTVQESLEGLFSVGHPGGIEGVVGNGGWWAFPVSGVVALAVVGLLRLGRAVLTLAARSKPPARLVAVPLARLVAVALVAPAPLALAAAGRAPPRTLLG